MCLEALEKNYHRSLIKGSPLLNIQKDLFWNKQKVWPCVIWRELTLKGERSQGRVDALCPLSKSVDGRGQRFCRLSGIHHSHIILGITHHPSNSCLCAHIGTVFSNTGDVLQLKLCSMWFLMCLILTFSGDLWSILSVSLKIFSFMQCTSWNGSPSYIQCECPW